MEVSADGLSKTEIKSTPASPSLCPVSNTSVGVAAAIVAEAEGIEAALAWMRATLAAQPDWRLLRFHLSTALLSTGDWRARSLQLPRGFGPLGRLVFGLRRPRRPILGTEAAR